VDQFELFLGMIIGRADSWVEFFEVPVKIEE
jgi:hypothetical protein